MMIRSLMGRGFSTVTLPRASNQAAGIAQFAKSFVASSPSISSAVTKRVLQFHTDSVICGVSALAQKTNAPYILWQEAQEHKRDSGLVTRCIGSAEWVAAEKGIAANSSAVREWDSNGTVFGYNAGIQGHQAGEFGHNDYYPVVLAAAHSNPNINGKEAVLAMILLDEIRGRLAEVFSLKTHKIDHVVHGAIASIATYGALMDASVEQIESAIGMFVAHYIPFRAIRAGKQLSDSKGASAALSTEAAIMCIHRAMRGFSGPKDVFRNPEAIFRLFEGPHEEYASPFDLVLTESGDDFAVMGMHFKLGLYEHQSAGAIHGITQLLAEKPQLVMEPDLVEQIKIKAYQPAFGIIGDPEKRTPTTRQSADHSMVYISKRADWLVSRILAKALKKREAVLNMSGQVQIWKELFLTPQDYAPQALFDPTTREIMTKINFEHGGVEYDSKYPEGIPTSVQLVLKGGKVCDSGFVMFPIGHARYEGKGFEDLLEFKFKELGKSGLSKKNLVSTVEDLQEMGDKTNQQLKEIYPAELKWAQQSIDTPLPDHE